MKKVIIFLGTRPEAIKLAPIIKALDGNIKFNTLVCSTGQHKEMLEQVIDFFQIKVHFSLNVIEPNQQLPGLTAKLLLSIDELLKAEQPDYIIVQGDTATTFTATLAAFYNKIKVLHVEAGLRTYDKFSPFPEEAYRVFTSHHAYFHYPPTKLTAENLLAEGVAADKMLITGNTVIDALLIGLSKIEKKTPKGILEYHLEGVKDFILVTTHRRENQGEAIRHICAAIERIVAETGVPVIFPVHLNPNIKNVVHECLGGNPLIHLTPPFAYPEFLWLFANSKLVLTDSGGVQEEAPTLGKPVLLLRDTTERLEGFDAGTVIKTGSDTELIYATAMKLLTDKDAYAAMATKSNPYGDGNAARRIVESMEKLAEES